MWTSLAIGKMVTDDFIHISTKSGLSNNMINCIVQDSAGFLWIGTDDGLNIYDGYNITVYRTIPGDSLSISGNIINSLLIDKNNTLWIATRHSGVCKYNAQKKSFTRFQVDPDNPQSLSHNGILSLAEDGNDNLWVGTYFGLNRINISTGAVFRYYTDILIDMSEAVIELQMSKGVPQHVIDKLKPLHQNHIASKSFQGILCLICHYAQNENLLQR